MPTAFGKGSFPGTRQSIDYLLGPAPQRDTVQLDNPPGGHSWTPMRS